MGNKQNKCIIAGTSSGIVATGGLIAMIATGPIGMVIGGAVLSGGLSGTFNSVSQAKNKN